ncbi:MAG: hypothetical protein DIU78_007015 [Pseudomonadota bacterium]
MRGPFRRRSSVVWFVLIQGCLLPDIEIDARLDADLGGSAGEGGASASAPPLGGAAFAGGAGAGAETKGAAGADGGAAGSAKIAGSGGAEGGAAGVGISGTEGGAGGAAGAAPRPCDPAFPQTPLAGLDACPEGYGCAPHPEGESVCIEQPGEAAWAFPCSETESDCAPGRFCDAAFGYCRPYCLDDSECRAVHPFRCASFAELGAAPLFAGEHEVGVCEACTDECAESDNGVCEDGGPGSVSAACAFGTDCSDCGAR